MSDIEPMTEAEALSTLLKSELWDMHKHVGWYSAPEKRFKEYGAMLIQAMIAARDEQWRAILADREKRAQAAQGWSHWEARIKQLMEGLGQPNSRSLYQAFSQLVNEMAQASKPVQAEAPHSDLMKFYGVDNLSALVEAQHRHIEKLQAKLPRNDQPEFTRVREG